MPENPGSTLAEAGIEGPGEEVQENPDFGTPDELITTTVECGPVAARKFASLEAHASQGDNIFFLQMGVDLFSKMMSAESFVRVLDPTGVLIDRHPVVGELGVEWLRVVVCGGVAQEVPRRIDEGVHRVGLAAGVTAALRALGAPEVGVVTERPVLLREQNREL